MSQPFAPIIAYRKWSIAYLKTFPNIVNLVGMHPTKNMIQIYYKEAPIGATYPHLQFRLQSSSPRNSQAKKMFDKFTVLYKFVWTGESDVVVVKPGQSNQATLFDAYTDLEKAFQRSQMQNNDLIVGFKQTGHVDYTSFEESVRYNHLGILVEMMLYPVSDQGIDTGDSLPDVPNP